MANTRKTHPRKKAVRHAEIVREFGERLRDARREAGLSQAELARLALTAVPYVGRLERGEAAPGIDLVERLVKALGIPLTKLLSPEPGDAPELRETARANFDDILRLADRPTIGMVNVFLSLVRDSVARRK